jgi:hypothetical protein
MASEIIGLGPTEAWAQFACVFPLKWHKYDPNVAQDYWEVNVG